MIPTSVTPLTLPDWQQAYRDGASPAALLGALRGRLVARGRDVAVIRLISDAELQARLAALDAAAAKHTDRAALLAALPRLSADNAQGELYLPDVLTLLREEGATVAAHAVTDPAIVLGINDRVQLGQARDLARARIVAAHQRAGVDIVDPASTQIDAGVRLGQDTVIEPFTILRGATTIGEDCRIGPGTTLTDVTAGDRVSVLHSYGVDARLADGASVGPFAYLRPGTVVRKGAKVGTFVEVKNSDIGAGSKVPHLSYLGDTDVGPGANLGAGTITANYDGRRKHRTTIGAGVRGSVHVSYVAPVTVGDRAWTAAGSVITDDVPEGALGVARARQTNVDGYDARRAAAAEDEEARRS